MAGEWSYQLYLILNKSEMKLTLLYIFECGVCSGESAHIWLKGGKRYILF